MEQPDRREVPGVSVCIAIAVKHMLAAGMAHDLVVAAIAEMETQYVAEEVILTPRQEANRRYYKNTLDTYPRLPPQEWQQLSASIRERDGDLCSYCGTDDARFCVDHIVPLSRGGSNDPLNLCVACIPCNSSKRDRLIAEWAGRSAGSLSRGAERTRRWRASRASPETSPNVTETVTVTDGDPPPSPPPPSPKPKVSPTPPSKTQTPPLTPPTSVVVSRATPSAFDEFWDAYPRKTGKGDAKASFAKAVKTAQAADLLNGLYRHLPPWRSYPHRLIPHPATWLNQGRWDDETPEEYEVPNDKLDRNIQNAERSRAAADRVGRFFDGGGTFDQFLGIE